ncbi:DUF6602 domain-containing protein [Caulobacter ginsengisoli]|nr:DUF6602 domain-containing protein [Caulobacter ginsengisoli]
MAFDGPAFIRHVAERLVHEFQFSQGAGTPGLIGAAKEHPARVQLARLMPGGVGVGSGIVVDSYGGVSRQQDIVIFEDLCPVFTHNDAPEATYYPVEGVIAVGEVKSGLGQTELNDSIAKSASVKGLRRYVDSNEVGYSFRQYCSGTSFAGAPEEKYDQDDKSLDQVYSFVLCQRFTLSSQTMLKHVAEGARAAGVAMMPNLVASLESGTLYAFNSASHAVARSMKEGDGAISIEDSMAGFAHLLAMLRLYVMSGRTVDRKHYERYFRKIGAPGPPSVSISGHVSFSQ